MQLVEKICLGGGGGRRRANLPARNEQDRSIDRIA